MVLEDMRSQNGILTENTETQTSDGESEHETKKMVYNQFEE